MMTQQDLAAFRGKEVEIYSKRVGTQGAYEGFVLNPFQSGTFLYRTGRVVGFGAKSLALCRARTWCEQNGLLPVEEKP